MSADLPEILIDGKYCRSLEISPPMKLRLLQLGRAL